MIGNLYDITLIDGATLSGYTLYKKGLRTMTVGYDGHEEDPTLPEGMVGVRRIINLADIREISPVG